MPTIQSGVHILVQIVSLHNPVSCICDSEMQSDFIGLVGKERVVLSSWFSILVPS